jgi:hypothetical protein
MSYNKKPFEKGRDCMFYSFLCFINQITPSFPFKLLLFIQILFLILIDLDYIYLTVFDLNTLSGDYISSQSSPIFSLFFIFFLIFSKLLKTPQCRCIDKTSFPHLPISTKFVLYCYPVITTSF